MAQERYGELTRHASIDLKKAQEVELWTDVLGIYASDLVDAVAVAGPSTSAVLQYIVDHDLVGKRLRSQKG